MRHNGMQDDVGGCLIRGRRGGAGALGPCRSVPQSPAQQQLKHTHNQPNKRSRRSCAQGGTERLATRIQAVADNEGGRSEQALPSCSRAAKY